MSTSVHHRHRHISTFPMNPSVLGKLSRAGFTTVNDFSQLSSSELVSEANISIRQAQLVLETLFGDNMSDNLVRKPVAPTQRSALELLQEKQPPASLVTCCQALDTLLGGGISLCRITEICGIPGVGKTQLCMQLAVDVQIPVCLGGLGGEAMYVDTEGSLIGERLDDLATAVVHHCGKTAGRTTRQGQDDIDTLTREKILSGIHCIRCHDHIELMAAVHLLPNMMRAHPKIKVVIVDSVAAPFRNNVDDPTERTKLLATLCQSCLQLASKYRVAVVLTNQLTTRVLPGSSYLVPALGEGWGHSCTTRLVLHWQGNTRMASLYKSPTGNERRCPFRVTVSGVRDVLPEVSNRSSNPAEHHLSDDPHDKDRTCTTVVYKRGTTQSEGTASTSTDTRESHRKRQRTT